MAEMTMTERVALAIRDAELGYESGLDFSSISQEDQRDYGLLARAAIAAMREPSERMCIAGGRFISKRGRHLPEDLARTAFVSMIDAALTEKETP